MKFTVLVATAAIGIIVASSRPASATSCPEGQIPDANGFGCVPSETIPEPVTILGTMAVGGTLLAKKFLNSRQAEK